MQRYKVKKVFLKRSFSERFFIELLLYYKHVANI